MCQALCQAGGSKVSGVCSFPWDFCLCRKQLYPRLLWAQKATLSCGCSVGKGGTDEVVHYLGEVFAGVQVQKAPGPRRWTVAAFITAAHVSIG